MDGIFDYASQVSKAGALVTSKLHEVFKYTLEHSNIVPFSHTVYTNGKKVYVFIIDKDALLANLGETVIGSSIDSAHYSVVYVVPFDSKSAEMPFAFEITWIPQDPILLEGYIYHRNVIDFSDSINIWLTNAYIDTTKTQLCESVVDHLFALNTLVDSINELQAQHHTVTISVHPINTTQTLYSRFISNAETFDTICTLHGKTHVHGVIPAIAHITKYPEVYTLRGGSGGESLGSMYIKSTSDSIECARLATHNVNSGFRVLVSYNNRFKKYQYVASPTTASPTTASS